MAEASNLEKELEYLGLLDKAREIYRELGERAALSYVHSSHRLLSKVYHPDLNPAQRDRAVDFQQRLNRVSEMIGQLGDEALLQVIRRDPLLRESDRKTILIVEDEAVLRTLFKNVLTMEGYRSITAEDGLQALSLFAQHRPDLILTDVIMPNLNGLELVRKLRETDFRIKVVYMSGFFGLEGMRGELEEDIRRFGYPTLTKPFKMSALLNVINRYMEEGAAAKFQKGV